jgi:hypothetical protein
MGQVREEGVFGPDRFGGGACLLDIEVVRMRVAVPQGVQHQHADSLETAQDLRRQPLGVGDVPQWTHPEPQGAHATMRDLKGKDLLAKQFKSLARIHGVQGEFGARGPVVRTSPGLEDVVEAIHQRVVGLSGQIDRERAPRSQGEDPKVVESVQVVGMQVG